MDTRLLKQIRPAALILLCSGALAGASDNATAQWPADTFAVLCYHDVRDEFRQRPDSYTVETRQLAMQFDWLREQGYHVISLDELIAARREHRSLPDRAILLTFDDGFESVYTRAFPLLKAFHYPALVALTGVWLEEPAPGESNLRYGDEILPRGDFLRAEQIRDMQQSGLIEFASHSYGLHQGIPANPQGNLEPAATARRFDSNRGVYEDGREYAERIRLDIAKSSADIERLGAVRPRAMVWPYGAHNRTTDQITRELGMPYGFTLDPGLNAPQIPLSGIRRFLITHDFAVADLARALREPARPAPLRVMHVDLDFVYDANAEQQEANLSLLLDRVKAMGVNTVFLQAFADPDGTGTAASLYFPNRRLPMRADLFNRVAWQLRTRTGVAVYAWMPLLAFDLPAADPAHDHWVLASELQRQGKVRRLSPFDPLVRAAVRDIYQDLATFASFQGVLFSDDATLNDFEDASAPALAVYRQWGLPADVAAIRAKPALSAQWSLEKIRYLTQFTLELADLLAADHDDLRTARNLFGGVVGNGQAQEWLGQSLSDALAAYDYVALMAMPYLEGQRRDPNRWLTHLVAVVATKLDGLDKTVFELQSVDWAKGNRPISGSVLAAQIAVLRRAGARQFGYYPDDFRNGHPALEALRPALSLAVFP